MSDSDSNGPVALITGSGRPRVGNLVARHLAACNYRIALHYHSSKEGAERSRDELRATGCHCEAFRADVADASEVDAMVEAIRDRFGRLDVAVTTSSIWSATPLAEVSKDELHRNFDINTLGTLFVARAAGRVMVDQPDGGCIVTFGDWSIARPYPDHIAYFLSKGAIPTLTRVLARELAVQNPKVRVNCIHPGPVMFPDDASEQRKSRLVDATLVKMADCPEAVARAVEGFIANPFVTGTCLAVDGGRHMYSPGEV